MMSEEEHAQQPPEAPAEASAAPEGTAATQEAPSKPEEDISGAANKIFYTNNPKDIRDGLAAGVGNFLKGGIGAAALIVSAPVKGAIDGSANGGGTIGAVKGFTLGLGMGIVGGAAMAVGGAATGVYQIGRGIINTPSAITESARLKEWDSEKRVWYEYRLQEEAEKYAHLTEEAFIQQLLAEHKQAPDSANNTATDGSKDVNDNADSTSSQSSVNPNKHVKERVLYDVLGVSPNATSAEIKKAYYLKARQNHPDRHPDDPEAHTRFQHIGAAYQVLSDERLRRDYDLHGKDGVENAPQMDNATLYAMVFGSEKFEPLVGELKLATQMQKEEEKEEYKPYADKLAALRQRQREIRIALNLCQRLQSYLDNGQDKEAFIAQHTEEVLELAKTPFGGTLVNTIGAVYLEHAQSELSTLDSLSVSLMQAGSSVYKGMSVASESLRAALTYNEVNKTQKKKSAAEIKTDAQTAEPNNAVTSSFSAEDEAALQKKVEKLSGHMCAVMWYVTEMDIRSTLFKACRKVTRDHGVDGTTLLLRCHALKALGELFLAHGKSAEAGLSDLLQRVKTQQGAPHAQNTQQAGEHAQGEKAETEDKAPPAQTEQSHGEID